MEFALKKSPNSECKSRLPIREGSRKVVQLLGAFLADRESGRKSEEAVSDGISFNENLKGVFALHGSRLFLQSWHACTRWLTPS